MAGPWTCMHCNRSFTRKGSLTRHIHRLHSGKPTVYDCQLCGLVFDSVNHMKSHYETHQFDQEYRLHESQFQGVFKSFTKIHSPDLDDANIALNQDREKIRNVILNELNLGVPVKVSLVLIANFYQYDQHDQATDQIVVPFRSSTFEVRQYSSVRDEMGKAINEIVRRMEDYLENGSGWVLDRLLRTNIEFGQTRSLRGSAGFSFAKTPEQAEKLNLDGGIDCFYQCIAHAITKKTNRKYLAKFIRRNITRIDESPYVHVSDIPKFIRENSSLSIRINVLYVSRGKSENAIYPIFCSKNSDAQNTANLLLHKVRDGEGRLLHHFSFIPNLNKFLRQTYVTEKQEKSYQKVHCCANCLGKFGTARSLKDHESICLTGKTQAVSICKDPIKFSKPGTSFPVPFIGFFDFESASEKNEDFDCQFCERMEKCTHMKTQIETRQTPIAYSLIIVDKNRKVIFKKSYTGPDPVNHMMSTMLSAYEKKISPLYQLNEELKMSREDEIRFQEAETCHICRFSFLTSSNEMEKVRDHDHYTGEFLGAAHQGCNFGRYDKRIIPLFAHNYSGYDANLIMKHLDPSKLPEGTKVSALPLNTEKIRTMRIGKFQLLDSYGFLQGSLEELARNLTRESENLSILDQMKLHRNAEEKKLLLRKGTAHI